MQVSLIMDDLPPPMNPKRNEKRIAPIIVKIITSVKLYFDFSIVDLSLNFGDKEQNDPTLHH